MVEYIERESLVQAIEDSWRNNPHSDPKVRQVHNHEHQHFLVLVSKQPTADVVPVVRCKDCEYWQSKNRGYSDISIDGFVSCYAADIWAACVSLYVMIKGYYPFPLESIETHLRQMTSYHDIPNLSGLSKELQDLLAQCFSPVISKRPTLQDILV